MLSPSYNTLLSELLRPQTLGDLCLPADLSGSFQRMAESRSPMNMLFYGRPGIGKTSAARILLREMDAEKYELNGSFNNGDKGMLSGISQFASTVSLIGGLKVCFIDEADYMTRAVQDGLRYLIEDTSPYCRFILTANEPDKLTAAIKSRCVPISFDVLPGDVPAVIERLASRYKDRLTRMGVSFDPSRLDRIVSTYFPDLRSVANRLELEFGQPKMAA